MSDLSTRTRKKRTRTFTTFLIVFIVIVGIAIISLVGLSLDSLKVAINKDRVEAFDNLSAKSSKLLDETINSSKEYSVLFADSFGKDYNRNEDMYEYIQNKAVELDVENSILLLFDSTDKRCITSNGQSFIIDDGKVFETGDEGSVTVSYLQAPPETQYMIFTNKLDKSVEAVYQKQKIKVTHTAVAMSVDYLFAKADSDLPADVDSFFVDENNEMVASRIITGLGISGDSFFSELFLYNFVKNEDREEYCEKLDEGIPFTYEFTYKGKPYAVGISKIADTEMKYVVVINSDDIGDSVEAALYRVITLCMIIVILLGFSAFFITFYFKKSKMDRKLLMEKEEMQEKLEHNLQIVALQKGKLEKQQKDLEEALVRANSSSRAKSIFLANMSHNLRTPMNAIMGFSTLASANIEDTGKVKYYLEKIDSSSNSLMSVINEILEMSDRESEKPENADETESTKDEKQNGGFDFSGKKALIVEDNRLNREILQELLLEIGIESETAENGQIALEIIESSPADRYDVILMDIQMPVMDGYEATRTIRALPDKEKSGIPILAVSAYAFEEDKRKAMEAGMNRHVAKPVNFEVLKNALEGVLTKC